MKKINILFLETGLGFGGAVTCLAAFLNRLDRNKYNPIFVSSHNDKSTQELIEKSQTRFQYLKGYERDERINQLLSNTARFCLPLKQLLVIFIIFIEKLFRIPFTVLSLRTVCLSVLFRSRSGVCISKYWKIGPEALTICVFIAGSL